MPHFDSICALALPVSINGLVVVRELWNICSVGACSAEWASSSELEFGIVLNVENEDGDKMEGEADFGWYRLCLFHFRMTQAYCQFIRSSLAPGRYHGHLLH